MRTGRDYIDDLTQIRTIMEKSSRFNSLSGLSGMLAGFYALAASLVIYLNVDLTVFTTVQPINEHQEEQSFVLAVLLVTLILTLLSAFVLSKLKARRLKEQFWNLLTQKVISLISVPLISGGFVLLLLYYYGLVGLIAPLSLVFYGISLCNLSRYTYEEFNIVGILQVVLGLSAMFFLEFSFLIWSIGFGLIHVVLGWYIFRKHEG